MKSGCLTSSVHSSTVFYSSHQRPWNRRTVDVCNTSASHIASAHIWQLLSGNLWRPFTAIPFNNVVAVAKPRLRRSYSFCKAGPSGAEAVASRESAVKQLPLQNIVAIHKYSYSHRNRRTVLLVVDDPDRRDGHIGYQEIERLAAGLKHETKVVVCKLSLKDSESRQYATQFLNLKQTPSMYIFPEGRRGFARYKGDLQAESILAAMNKICSPTDLDMTKPDSSDVLARRKWELKGEPLNLVPLPGDALASTSRFNPGADKIDSLITQFTWLMWAVGALIAVKTAIGVLYAFGMDERQQRDAFAVAVVMRLQQASSLMSTIGQRLQSLVVGVLAAVAINFKKFRRRNSGSKLDSGAGNASAS